MVKIDNVKIADIGFYMNLEHRTDRKEHLLNNLKELNITGVERYPARYENVYEDNKTPQINLLNTTFDIYEKFLETDAETLLILEDDCKFLPIMKEHAENIFNDIYSCDWDFFWLGCKNNKPPLKYKNNCYRVALASYAQSYIIKRKMCEDILTIFKPHPCYMVPDEFISLFTYGEDVARNDKKYNFHNLEQPLDVLKTEYTSLCYALPLSTQYNSYSDLWHHETNLEDWLPRPHETMEPPSWLS